MAFVTIKITKLKRKQTNEPTKTAHSYHTE